MITIAIDEASFETIDGIPDIVGTRLFCCSASLPCILFAIWLPVAGFAKISSVNSPGFVVILILLAASLSAGLAIALVWAALKPGAWFRVSSDGVEFGNGPYLDHPANGQRIEWGCIERNPERTYDIGIAAEAYRVAPNARMTFWYRDANGALVQRFLPLQLRSDVLGCLRFRNAHEVRVALLRRLAKYPDLRFDPDVFVRAGIDPENWSPMLSPNRASWLAASIVMACILGFASLLGVNLTTGQLTAGTIGIFVGGLLLYMRWWPLAHPRLTEVITFRSITPSADE
ncbi:hypothetical protein WBP07_20655 (plasmid) [Novosphingobium sp. BL-8A]|uniref:hypothetical protein n=1 Tax=Novosphingobium sp. BL-8A TaxID=3127639 RepID=UPI003757BA44